MTTPAVCICGLTIGETPDGGLALLCSWFSCYAGQHGFNELETRMQDMSQRAVCPCKSFSTVVVVIDGDAAAADFETGPVGTPCAQRPQATHQNESVALHRKGCTCNPINYHSVAINVTFV